MFADRAKIIISSGKGGDGHVSFRREKYVAAGGPDGGDGGKGGDVIFEVDPGANTLADYRHRRKYAAENGEEGGKRRCHGKDGADIVLKVPEGTVVLEAESGKVIADLSSWQKRVTVLLGGLGGKGNMHFATPTMQVPKYAQPGGPGKEMEVRLELKLIADVGLIGFPNVGKSTLLSRASRAKPKIANYPFTTLQPNLGVVDLPDASGFVMADIPGLVEGASDGAGLGHEFLRHIERTRLLVHLVDAAGTEGRDPVEDIAQINRELAAYSEGLSALPQIVVANKTDLLQTEEEQAVLGRIKDAACAPDMPVFPISAATGKGVRELLYYIRQQLDQLPERDPVFAQEFDPEVELAEENLPYTVERVDAHLFSVEGPKIEKMLGYTNLDSEKGFAFFQKFLAQSGILEDLRRAGIEEGDTVRMYGHQFDYLE